MYQGDGVKGDKLLALDKLFTLLQLKINGILQ